MFSIENSSSLYEDFKKNYEFIEHLAKFPTQFGVCIVSLFHNLCSKKFYTVKELQSSEQNLKPIHDFLNDFEVFQSSKENSKFLVTIQKRFKYKDPENSSVSIFIIQKNYKSYRLSKLFGGKNCEMEVLVILRELSRFYSLLLDTPFAKAFQSAPFLKTLNPHSIFYFEKAINTKQSNFEKNRLKIDFLDFNEEYIKKSSQENNLINLVKKKENLNKRQFNLENLHLYEFGELIVQLLFNSSLTPNQATKDKPIFIADMKQRVGVCLKTLFLRIFLDPELKLGEWKNIFSNPIMNQNLERRNDLNFWKYSLRDKKAFERFEIYRYKSKISEKEEQSKENLNKGDQEKKTLIKNLESSISDITSKKLQDLEKKRNILKDLGRIRDEILAIQINMRIMKLQTEDIFCKYEAYKTKMEIALKEFTKSDIPKNSLEFRCFLKIKREYLIIKYNM